MKDRCRNIRVVENPSAKVFKYDFDDGSVDHYILENALQLHEISCTKIEQHIYNPFKDMMSDHTSILATKYGSSKARAEATLLEYRVREIFIHEFGYVIPCREMVEAMPKKILDPIAGTGYLARAISLADKAKDIIASDIARPHRNHYKFTSSYFTMKQMNALRAVKRYPEYDILMSWSPYNIDIGAKILEVMDVGCVLYYIGESAGGCTGNDRMFDVLDSDFEFIAEVGIPQFSGIRDSLKIYGKRR